jgi:protein-disulfide isomerase
MRRTIAAMALAAAALLPAVALPQDQSRPALSDMSEADREALRTEIRAYLLEHPEVLSEAIQVLEQRRAADRDARDAALIAENSNALFGGEHNWVAGNPDGDITVVEFSDYRCGYCKRAHPEIKELLERDSNIRLVVKEFPILGPDSVTAAKIAQAALDIDPERFGALHDELMAFQGQLSEAAAYQIAGTVGYDVAALKERAGSPDIEKRIGANYALARTLGLEGTPSFVVGKQILRGYLPLDGMIDVVALARATTN